MSKDDMYGIDVDKLFDSMLTELPVTLFRKYIETCPMDKTFYKECLVNLNMLIGSLTYKITIQRQSGLYVDRLICDYFMEMIKATTQEFSQTPVEFTAKNKRLLKFIFLADCTVFNKHGFELLKNTSSVNFTNDKVEDFRKIHHKICDELAGMVFKKDPKYVNLFIKEVNTRCVDYFQKHGKRSKTT